VPVPRLLSGLFLLFGIFQSVPELKAQDAATAPEIRARAEAEFAKGTKLRHSPEQAHQHFAKAAEYYRELHGRGVRNGDLYRNLGNAALLADDLPQAIWAYRQGVGVIPNDAGLRDHLEYARSQVDYPGPGYRGRPRAGSWPPWLPRPHPDVLLILAFCIHSVACVLVTLRVARSTYNLRVPALFFAAAVVLGLGWGVLDSHERLEEHYPVVVITEETPLYRGNGASYPAHDESPSLAPGREGRRLHARGDWLQIRLTGGEIGWVPRQAVLVGEP
jgi:hypothetical protein